MPICNMDSVTKHRRPASYLICVELNESDYFLEIQPVELQMCRIHGLITAKSTSDIVYITVYERIAKRDGKWSVQLL